MPTPNEFSRVNFSNAAAPEEYGQVQPDPSNFGPYPGPEMVPEPARSDAQFSSDNSGDPESLAADSSDSQNAFAELQTFLMNNLETPGTRVCHPQSKPWSPPHGAEGE